MRRVLTRLCLGVIVVDSYHHDDTKKDLYRHCSALGM